MSLRCHLWRQDAIFAILLVASALGHWGLGYVGGASELPPVPIARQQGQTTVAIELVAAAEPIVQEALPPVPPWKPEDIALESPILEVPLLSDTHRVLSSKKSTYQTARIGQRSRAELIPQQRPEMEPLVQRLPPQPREMPQLEIQAERVSRKLPSREVQVASQVPLEKLPETAEATQTVRQQGSTGAPVPPQVRSRPDPVHPRELLRRRIEASVRLKVRVSISGKVTNIQIAQSSGYEAMDKSAVEAVRRWEFTPGRRNGQPAAMTVIVPIEFRIIRR
ncbi:MAG: energy transducer TonB [Pirellulaceae bacterium]